MPTGRPVRKTHRHVSSAEDRYLMTVIATASNPDFEVSRLEIDRPGDTYTVDTMLANCATSTARAPSCSSSPAPTRCARS